MSFLGIYSHFGRFQVIFGHLIYFFGMFWSFMFFVFLVFFGFLGPKEILEGSGFWVFVFCFFMFLFYWSLKKWNVHNSTFRCFWLKTSILIDRFSDIVSQVSMSCIGGLAFNKKREYQVLSLMIKKRFSMTYQQTVSVLCDMCTEKYMKIKNHIVSKSFIISTEALNKTRKVNKIYIQICI